MDDATVGSVAGEVETIYGALGSAAYYTRKALDAALNLGDQQLAQALLVAYNIADQQLGDFLRSAVNAIGQTSDQTIQE